MNRIALVAAVLASTSAFAASSNKPATATQKPATSRASASRSSSRPSTSLYRSSYGSSAFSTPTNPVSAMMEANMRISGQMMEAAMNMNPFFAMAKNMSGAALMFSPLGYGARFSPLGY